MTKKLLTLEPTLPLDGYSKDFGKIKLTENEITALTSIARPLGDSTELYEKFQEEFGVLWPEITCSSLSQDGRIRFLGLQSDLIFALGGDLDDVPKSIGKKAYFTDQSDAWVCLTLAGEDAERALERICPLDLHIDSFTTGSISRTVMEHLGVIIIRHDVDQFLLLSATSSAESFLHTLEKAIEGAC